MIGWILLGMAGLYLLSAIILSMEAAKLLCRPKRWSFREKRAQQEKLGFTEAFRWYDSMQWECFTVSRKDAVLHGQFLHNGAGSKVFVFCHGHTSNIASGVKCAALFWEMGYSVVLYDARFFGTSTGTHCTMGQRETEDLAAVLAWVRDTFGAETKIALMGESMGAATVLNVMDREKPMLVVADCPFADLRLLLRYMIPMSLHVPPQPALWLCGHIVKERYGLDLAAMRPMDAAAKADVPILLIHGTDDRLIPYIHSEYMSRHLRHPLSRLALFEGADHARSFSDDPEKYRQTVTAFVQAAEKADTEYPTP